MRPEGKPDIALGKDHGAALAKWDELHNKKPRVKGTIEEAFALWEEHLLPTYANAETRADVREGAAQAPARVRPLHLGGVKLPHLIGYLEKRKGKTQANRRCRCSRWSGTTRASRA
jgi:hypothetical protein